VRDYGIFDEENEVGTRATFTVDKDGRIRHVEQGKKAIDLTGPTKLVARSAIEKPAAVILKTLAAQAPCSRAPERP
jgi:peroxiredoxin